jgi:hypothetical protein
MNLTDTDENSHKKENLSAWIQIFVLFSWHLIIEAMVKWRRWKYNYFYIVSWHLLGHAIKSVTCFDLQFSRSTRPMTSFCIFIAYMNTEGILFNVKITRWEESFNCTQEEDVFRIYEETSSFTLSQQKCTALESVVILTDLSLIYKMKLKNL